MRVQFLKFPSDRTKPGRSLTQFDFQMIESLGMHFPYRVIFEETEIVAGNHYHRQRQELIICMFGNVLAAVEDPQTKERQERILADDVEDFDNAVFIPAGIAHAVKSLGPSLQAVIYVFATGEPRTDDIDYTVIEPTTTMERG